MTVSTDIATAVASERRVYLAIDGVEPLFFQRGDRASPSWSRSVKQCLRPPSESTLELDLGDMTPSLSAMTFELDDIENADGTSYFGQLFAPNAWATVNHARVSAGLTDLNNIPANGITIPVKATADFTSPGTAYLGQETINYTGITGTSFTNVTKGVYPCVNIGQTYGWTVDRPPDGARGYHYHVGKKPFSFFGRRVAMYLITWDRETNAWRPEAEARLVWAGRISDRIVRDGRTGTWKLSCKSVLEELQNKVFRTAGKERIDGINLSGGWGRKVDITLKSQASGTWFTVYGYELCASGHYDTPAVFLAAVNKQLAALQYKINWVQFTAGIGLNGKSEIVAVNYIPASASGSDDYTVVMIPAKGDGGFCHALNALGFDGWKGITFNVPKTFVKMDGDYFYVYHPLDRLANGATMYLAKDGKNYPSQSLVESQRDEGADPDVAYFMVEKAVLNSVAKLDGSYFGSYTAKSVGFPARLTLSNEPIKLKHFSGHIGLKYGDNPWTGPEVRQVLIPKYKEVKRTRGPFEMLLNMLVSTGVKGYNGTYDVYPSGWGLAIQRELVDEQSFIDADKSVLPSSLAQRKAYIISSPESWIELAQRECKLFGFAVVWRQGKIRVRRVLDTNRDDWTVTIDESARAGHDWPDMDIGSSVVINQYVAEIVYNHYTGKYNAPYIITDVDSALGTTVVKQVKLKHPGVYLASDVKETTAAKLSALLKTELLGRFIRYPSALVSVTLGPKVEDQVFVGDKVKFVTTTLMSPTGTGTLGFTAYATVIQSGWDWEKHTGTATLLVHDFKKYGVNFTPTTKIDFSAGNAGWDPAATTLTVKQGEFTTTSSHDGAAVSGGTSGWKVTIKEQAPTNPDSPQTFGPIGIVNYHAANTTLILDSNTTLAGWDNAKEYVVTFAPYAEINISQANVSGVSAGTWAANVDTESLSDVIPYRWG